MNSYELSRSFWDWSFENPELVKPLHSAIFFFAIEHCNRLGWKEKFGFPSQMVMESIGVKNWRTYSKGLNDLVEFGFINMIERSKNQYSSNIIAIVKNTKAPTKALDKALSKHSTKHSTKHSQSTVSIDKQLNKEQLNKEPSIDFSSIKEDWNSLSNNLPKLKTLTDARKKTIKARIKEHGRIDLTQVFKKAGESKFMQGENDKKWKANFDWCMNPNNFVKILEGNYDNKEKPKKTYLR